MSVQPANKLRLSIGNLMAITAVAAVIAAMARCFGAASLFVMCYAFAPAVAALATGVMRRHTAKPRYLVGVAVLATFLMSMAVFGAINYGVESLPMILAGTLIEWPGQIAVLFCLRAITRGNSYAHDKDSIECNRAASAYAPPT